MKYTTEIQAVANDPVQLEDLYQRSRQENDEAEFRSDLLELYENSPDNLLYSAWHSRFTYSQSPKSKRTTHWGLAVVFGVITGLVLWVISDPELLFLEIIPIFILFWAPVATILTLIYLAIISKRNYQSTIISCVVLLVVSAYIFWITPKLSDLVSQDYLTLMVFQLPLLCWIGIGAALLGYKSSDSNRFAFLIKSIEVMITAGVYLIFGLVFGMITMGMFAALDITLPDSTVRLIAAGGLGLIIIMSITTIYEPTVTPEKQDFSLGLSKFVFTMMRLLLPLTLLVLVIYLLIIPFNFMAPFENRDLLIVYNVMQFAIVGLLIGATPLKVDDLSGKMQTWLQRGIIAVSILALIISLYALSAVIYRTVMDGITLNRLTIIGWNVINITIFFALTYSQLRKNNSGWHEHLQKVFSMATIPYLVWSLFLIIALPLIFR